MTIGTTLRDADGIIWEITDIKNNHYRLVEVGGRDWGWVSEEVIKLNYEEVVE